MNTIISISVMLFDIVLFLGFYIGIRRFAIPRRLQFVFFLILLIMAIVAAILNLEFIATQITELIYIFLLASLSSILSKRTE